MQKNSATVKTATGTTIQIRRGLETQLPADAAEGEFLFCLDSNKLFSGMGAGIPPVEVAALIGGTPVSATPPVDGQTLVFNAAQNKWIPAVRVGAIQFVLDGGGLVPSIGPKGQISIPFACTLKGWILTADQPGSAVVDILRSTYAAFPTTSSIAGTDKPTLSSAQKNQNLGPLSAWGSTALAAGDELQVALSSVATVTRLNLTLNLTVP